MKSKLGENIACFRKKAGLTQEQLATAVGVSAPAVSKWETGSSLPDITLLAPLARALNTTADGLLSFQDELTETELKDTVSSLKETFTSHGFSAGQALCEDLLHQYPNSSSLKLSVVSLYQTMLGTLSDDLLTEEYLHDIFLRCAQLCREIREKRDPRYFAASTVSLASFALSEGRLAEMEELLNSLPKTEIDPEEMYPSLYLAQGRTEEAEILLERRLYRLIHSSALALLSLSNIATRREDRDRALFFCGISEGLTRLMELPDLCGTSQVAVAHLARAGRTDEAMERLSDYIHGLMARSVDYSNHPIFPHITLSATAAQMASTRKLTAKSLETDPAFSSLREDPRFPVLLSELLEESK